MIYYFKAITQAYILKSSLPGQNGRDFTGYIFSCIFVNESFCIMIKILLKFAPQGPIV